MVTAPGVPVGDVGSKGLVFLLELKAYTHTPTWLCKNPPFSPVCAICSWGPCLGEQHCSGGMSRGAALPQGSCLEVRQSHNSGMLGAGCPSQTCKAHEELSDAVVSR